MKRKLLLLLVTSVCVSILHAQSTNQNDSNYLISINQQIDNYVISKDTAALNWLYADDFIFSHGSGRVEGKKGWFNSVVKGGFLMRQHDSVKVELHPELAIVKGKLSVLKKGKEKTDSYYLYYIRVYANREKKWQLVSHSTTSEYHLPGIIN